MTGIPGLPHQADHSMLDSELGTVLISSRSLDEYRAMFALSDDDLQGEILDCPGGASSATAEINAAGGNARAVDPVYGMGLSAAQLGTLSQAETDRGNAYVRRHPEQYRWTFFTNAAEHHRSRSEAGRRFAADYRADSERYVAGALPRLPFHSHSFDLVVSSHLLFSYADRLTSRFHRDAINELVRVSRRQVRIFPLIAMGSAAFDTPGLIRQLRDDGITATARDVEYEFQVGGHQMLVCARNG